MRGFPVLALATVAMIRPVAAQTPGDTTYAIHAAAMLDVARGVIVSDPIIITRGGRIVAAGPARSIRVPAGAVRIELDSATLMPGLMDGHVHLALGGRPRDNAVATLRAGFTTVQDLGSLNGVNLRLRDSIAAGRWPGPRVVAAGNWIGVSGGTCDFDGRQLSGAEPMAGRVREQINAGANVIKVCVTGWPAAADRPAELSGEELAAVVREARAARRRVVAHAIGWAGARAAVDAGVNALAHSAFLDSAAAAEARRRGVVMIPTLASIEAQSNASAHQLAGHAARVIAWGVPVVFGTDAGVIPHGANAGEFAALARAGLTPAAAIRAATSDAARALGLADSLGTLTPGFVADIIAVRGDPLASLANMERVVFVMQAGRVVLRRDAQGVER